jgi:PqqD family protein of HPr-rel-A system
MPPEHSPGLVSRHVDGEAVVLDRDTGTVHRLNATATCIWDHCNGKNTPADIAAAVAAAFDSPPDDVLADTERTLADMRRLGLLRETGTGAG